MSMKKFAAITSTSIEKTKKFRYAKKRTYPRSPPMYEIEYRWMSIDTPVTTSIIITLSGSIRIDTCASTPAVAA